MTDVVTAIKALLNGQEIRRENWPKDMWISLSSDKNKMSMHEAENIILDVNSLSFHTDDFTATDWQYQEIPK